MIRGYDKMGTARYTQKDIDNALVQYNNDADLPAGYSVVYLNSRLQLHYPNWGGVGAYISMHKYTLAMVHDLVCDRLGMVTFRHSAWNHAIKEAFKDAEFNRYILPVTIYSVHRQVKFMPQDVGAADFAYLCQQKDLGNKRETAHFKTDDLNAALEYLSGH